MTKLVILIPSAGTVHLGFFHSIIGLTQSLQKRGIVFQVKTFEFSDLVVSRNYLASYFLSASSFTHALMLDSDLAFAPAQFFRLLEFDQDFAAGAYPDRRITSHVLSSALKSAAPDDIKDGPTTQRYLAGHMNYVLSTTDGKTPPFKAQNRDGFHSVTSVGAGFVLIKRAVVEGISDSGLARPLPRMGQLADFKDAPRFSDFFSHLPTEDGQALLGEDQSFCKRWRAGCGGEIWVDLASSISHTGAYTHYGNYQEFIESSAPD